MIDKNVLMKTLTHIASRADDACNYFDAIAAENAQQAINELLTENATQADTIAQLRAEVEALKGKVPE